MTSNNSQALKQKVRRLWIQRLAYGSIWLVFIYIVAIKIPTVRKIVRNPRIVTSLIKQNEYEAEHILTPEERIYENNKQAAELIRGVSQSSARKNTQKTVSDSPTLWITIPFDNGRVSINNDSNRQNLEVPKLEQQNTYVFEINVTDNENFCDWESELLYRFGLFPLVNEQEPPNIERQVHTISAIINRVGTPISEEERQKILIDLFFLAGALCLLVIAGIASRRTRLTIALPLLEELQLYLPEECAAELHIIKEELEASDKPELYIRLRVIQEYLEVLWSNQVVIRVENLWLPSSKRID